MRRYKGNMLLVELVITLIFFSLSMTIIMQVFAAAQSMASESRVTAASLARAQDLAERLTREREPDALLKRMGYAGQEGRYVWSDEGGYDLMVTIQTKEQPAGRLTSVAIEALMGDKTLFTLPSASYLPSEEAAP